MAIGVGTWVGIGCIVVLLALLAYRPILARIGHQNAVARPKQLALIAVGLLVATAIFAASDVTESTLRTEIGRALVAGFGEADVIVSPRSFFPWDEQWVEAGLAQPDVAALVHAHSMSYPWQGATESIATLLGEPQTAILGVHYDDAKRMGHLDEVAGAPVSTLGAGRPGEWLVDETLARALDVRVGDSLRLFLDPLPIPNQGNQTFNGTLALAAQGLDGAYTHSPADVYSFAATIPEDTFGVVVAAFPNPPLPIDLDLEIVLPNGDVVLLDNGTNQAPDQPFLNTEVPRALEGDWTLNVHAKQAAGVAFQLVVFTLSEPASTNDIVPLEGEVVTIVKRGSTSASFGGQGVLVIPLVTLQDEVGFKRPVRNVEVDLVPGTNATIFEQRFVSALAALPPQVDDAGNPQDTNQLAFELLDVQQDIARDLEDTRFIQFIFLTFGSFTIAAGVLLILTLVSMLVEERRVTLSTLRAIGGGRFDITQMYVHEGVVYGALATILGLLVGVGFAAVMMWMFTDAVGVPFRGPTFEASGLWSAAGIGFTLVLVVIGVATQRVAGFHVALGLKGEEHAMKQRGWKSWVLTVAVLTAGTLAAVLGFATDSYFGIVLGPTFAAAGLAGILVRRFAKEVIYPVVGAGILLWNVASFFFLDMSRAEDAEFFLFPLRGVIMTIAGTVVVAYGATAGRIASWLFRRVRFFDPIADPASAYARQRPTRTALTVAMIAMVITVITFMNTVASFDSGAIAGTTGGVDAFGFTTSDIGEPAAWLASQGDAARGDPFALFDAWAALPFAEHGVQGARTGDDFVWGMTWSSQLGDSVLGVVPDVERVYAIEPASAHPAYTTSASALAAVRENPDLAIGSTSLFKAGQGDSLETVEVGDTVRLMGASGSINVTVISVFPGALYGGLWVHPDVARNLDASSSTMIMARAASGVDARDAARALEVAFRPAGMNAHAPEELIEEEQRETSLFVGIMDTYLSMGLIVGIASIAIITLRNVIVRRQEIGVLRAVGARSSHILSMFALETLFVLALGILVGLFSGLMVAVGAFQSGAGSGEFADFTVPWGSLGIIISMVVVGGLLAGTIPARRGARIPPAQATRYLE